MGNWEDESDADFGHPADNIRKMMEDPFYKWLHEYNKEQADVLWYDAVRIARSAWNKATAIERERCVDLVKNNGNVEDWTTVQRICLAIMSESD